MFRRASWIDSGKCMRPLRVIFMTRRRHHPRNLKPLDATIRFQSCSRDLIQVTELVNGGNILQKEMRQNIDVVAELEKKYIFFADEANTARKLVSKGRSGVFQVYLREP